VKKSAKGGENLPEENKRTVTVLWRRTAAQHAKQFEWKQRNEQEKVNEGESCSKFGWLALEKKA